MTNQVSGADDLDATQLAQMSGLVARVPALGGTPDWRFRYRSRQVEILAAPSTIDGAGAERAMRLAVISAAAAITNLRLVIGHQGYEPAIELVGDASPGGLLARVGPGARRSPVPDDERLYAALIRLPDWAGRARLDGAEVDDEDLGLVISAGLREAAADLEITEPSEAGLTALDTALTDPDGHQGWHPPGFGAARALVLSTRRDDPGAWLATGRALQAMRLEAACQGLGANTGVPLDQGAFGRLTLGRIVVPGSPGSLAQVAVQIGASLGT